MAGEPYVTVIGNLAGDPELRFTASGHAVANFTIAQTPRTRDQQSNEWVDDETLWFRCSVWRDVAENVAESLTKGSRVIAYGRLNARSFETKEGQQRTNWELAVDEIGPSLRWATAQVNRTPKQGGGFSPQPQGNAGWGGDPGSSWGAQPPAGDPSQSKFGDMTGAWGGGGTQNQGNEPPPF